MTGEDNVDPELHRQHIQETKNLRELGVNPRTVRAWESGRDPVPVRIRAELDVLAGEHDQTLADMIEHAEDHQVVGIFRDKGAPVPHPRGWYVAAAARAMDSHPDMVVAWLAHQ